MPKLALALARSEVTAGQTINGLDRDLLVVLVLFVAKEIIKGNISGVPGN